MSHRPHTHRYPHPGQTANRTHAAYGWSHNSDQYNATMYPYRQETSVASPPLQHFRPYPGNLHPTPTSTMTPVSHPTLRVSTPTELMQVHSDTYSDCMRYAQHTPAVIEAVPPSYYSHTASNIAPSIQPAFVFPPGATSTGIHHDSAHQQTARINEYRDMSPISLYGSSPSGSPASSSSSYYQSLPPSQPTNAYPLSPSLEPIPFLPQDPVNRVPCLWRGCNIKLDDISTAGIKRHIRDWHSDLSTASQKDRRTCLWDDGTICGRELDAASFAKHIASVHLHSTAQKCEYCHNMIGRADSLARHKRDHCPERPRQ